MIFIHKSAKVPAPLDGPDSPGGKETQRLCAAYEAGTREFDFLYSIYGHAAVKNALIADQHEKCAFCEAKILHTSYGDVEHFRPKGGFQQAPGEKLTKPGYYWLAYEWSNLTLSCQRCNQEFKKNHFPLFNPRNRARSHRANLAREQPILVDPTVDDPQDFIGFQEEVARGNDSEGRGECTIERLGLRRDKLNDNRREKLFFFRTSWKGLIAGEKSTKEKFGAITDPLIELRTLLQSFVLPDHEYSAMYRAAAADLEDFPL